MRSLLLLAVLVAGAAPLRAADALADARRLYNQGQYDDAERAAREALRIPASAEGARVVLGRIQLERYRRSSAPAELSDAIAALTRGRCAPARCARANRADDRPRRSAVSRGSIRRGRGALRVGARRLGGARPGGARPRAGLVGDGPRPAGAEPAVRRAAGALRADRRPHGRGNRERRRIAARRATGWRRPRGAPGTSIAR